MQEGMAPGHYQQWRAPDSLARRALQRFQEPRPQASAYRPLVACAAMLLVAAGVALLADRAGPDDRAGPEYWAGPETTVVDGYRPGAASLTLATVALPMRPVLPPVGTGLLIDKPAMPTRDVLGVSTDVIEENL